MSDKNKLSTEEILKRLQDIIDSVMELAIDLEFGGWDEFNKQIKELYPSIKIPEEKTEKDLILVETKDPSDMH